MTTDWNDDQLRAAWVAARDARRHRGDAAIGLPRLVPDRPGTSSPTFRSGDSAVGVPSLVVPADGAASAVGRRGAGWLVGGGPHEGRRGAPESVAPLRRRQRALIGSAGITPASGTP
jgi:hypothetical protein